MFKKDITYEDFDGNTVTETFWFHIGKTDLFDLDVEHEEGLEDWLKHISETKDKKAMLEEFKRIIRVAYGERSEDGKRFIKSPEIAEAFTQTAAYEALFMELATDDKAAAEFIIGALPRDVGKEAAKAMEDREVEDGSLPPGESAVEDPAPKAETTTES